MLDCAAQVEPEVVAWHRHRRCRDTFELDSFIRLRFKKSSKNFLVLIARGYIGNDGEDIRVLAPRVLGGSIRENSMCRIPVLSIKSVRGLLNNRFVLSRTLLAPVPGFQFSRIL